MITRLEIDGFKSLRDFSIDLEPFTVLIGPNSAGKSNIIDALSLLSRLMSMPLNEAFKRGRGRMSDQFSRRSTESANQIRIAVEFLLFSKNPEPNGKQSRFRYELVINREPESINVEKESFFGLRMEQDTWATHHANLAPYFFYNDAGHVYIFENANVKPQSLRPNSLHRTSLFDAAAIEPTLAGLNLYQTRILDLNTFDRWYPAELLDSEELARDASNLPAVLHRLHAAEIGQIRADLTSLVPGISSFYTIAENDEVRLEFEVSGGERVPAKLVSAGTLRILALLTALAGISRPAALCVEEPENGIYPGRLRALLDLLQQSTERTPEDRYNALPTQVILTTHSPVALAALHGRPQHLRFVDMVRRDGARVTRARTVGQPGPGERGQHMVSMREIDALLNSIQPEAPE